MAYCTKCGKQIDDDSVFCPYCGASQGNIQPEAELNPEYNSSGNAEYSAVKAINWKTIILKRILPAVVFTAVCLVICFVHVQIMEGYMDGDFSWILNDTLNDTFPTDNWFSCIVSFALSIIVFFVYLFVIRKLFAPSAAENNQKRKLPINQIIAIVIFVAECIVAFFPYTPGILHITGSTIVNIVAFIIECVICVILLISFFISNNALKNNSANNKKDFFITLLVIICLIIIQLMNEQELFTNIQAVPYIHTIICAAVAVLIQNNRKKY